MNSRSQAFQADSFIHCTRVPAIHLTLINANLVHFHHFHQFNDNLLIHLFICQLFARGRIFKTPLINILSVLIIFDDLRILLLCVAFYPETRLRAKLENVDIAQYARYYVN